MGASKRKAGNPLFADAVLAALDQAAARGRMSPTRHGLQADVAGQYHRGLLLRGADAPHAQDCARFLDVLRRGLAAAYAYQIEDAPFQAGVNGAIVAPGVSAFEFEAFRKFCSNLTVPVWVEFQVGDVSKGLLVLPNYPEALVYETTGVASTRTISVMPFATVLSWGEDGLRKGIFDPAKVYAKVAAEEAVASGMGGASNEEIMLMMTREADMAALGCIGLGLGGSASTELAKTGPAGQRRFRVRVGRDATVDGRRQEEGMPPWPAAA